MFSTYIFTFFALPEGRARFGLIVGVPGRVQDGLGIVLVRTLFRLGIGIAFWTFSGASWSRFGASLASCWAILGYLGLILGRLGLAWARFWQLPVAFWSPIALYVHQLINLSALQPMVCQHFALQAGGLREAIQSAARTARGGNSGVSDC